MLEKIAEPKKICRHPEHEPPKDMYLTPGTYKYTCPGCGKVKMFTVPEVTF